MRIILAPMEGVVDQPMRELLTGLGGFDRCVTEFVRVTDTRFPERVFYRYCPELKNGGKTMAGTPVYIQLLGGKPHWMAVNAAKAATLGAPGIDINFGCPAKVVNKNDGGSVLLKEPERVADIVSAVRDAVDPATPVTAKIRLGFSDDSLLEDIAGGIEEAGASELCIHARTREDGYKPPAHWHQVKKIREQLSIPVIINGEIWSVENAQQALKDSDCVDLMLGRGALACPDLVRQIRANFEARPVNALSWLQVLDSVEGFFSTSDRWTPKYVGNRTKQWLAYLRRQYSGAELLFSEIKTLKTVEDIQRAIVTHRRMQMPEAV